jgi:hypothetical protein
MCYLWVPIRFVVVDMLLKVLSIEKEEIDLQINRQISCGDQPPFGGIEIQPSEVNRSESLHTSINE